MSFRADQNTNTPHMAGISQEDRKEKIGTKILQRELEWLHRTGLVCHCFFYPILFQRHISLQLHPLTPTLQSPPYFPWASIQSDHFILITSFQSVFSPFQVEQSSTKFKCEPGMSVLTTKWPLLYVVGVGSQRGVQTFSQSCNQVNELRRHAQAWPDTLAVRRGAAPRGNTKQLDSWKIPVSQRNLADHMEEAAAKRSLYFCWSSFLLVQCQ